ncbi:MAG TPA: class II aldolase/adducin family protein [Chloroflexota bacterium]|nr:class II aldolase/adducin family protein [Chloroflexota bacterium]
MSGLDDVLEEVALASRMLFEMGLADAATIERGHVSLRVPGQPDRFVIKALGPALSMTRKEHMVVVDVNGFKVGGPRELNLPNEVKMHSCILRERPDVNSVVHVHPRYTVLMSVLQEQLAPMCIEGMQLFNEPLPLFPSPRLIIREEDGVEVAKLLGARDAILLQGHGAATVGADMEDSITNMLCLEEQARMNYLAFCAAGRDHAALRPEQRVEFAQNMRRLGEQEHLKPEVAPTPRKPSGIWNHYARLAAE